MAGLVTKRLVLAAALAVSVSGSKYDCYETYTQALQNSPTITTKCANLAVFETCVNNIPQNDPSKEISLTLLQNTKNHLECTSTVVRRQGTSAAILTKNDDVYIQTDANREVKITQFGGRTRGLWNTIDLVDTLDSNLTDVQSDLAKAFSHIKTVNESATSLIHSVNDSSNNKMLGLQTQMEAQISLASSTITANEESTQKHINQLDSDINSQLTSLRLELQKDINTSSQELSGRLEDLNCKSQGQLYDANAKTCVDTAWGRPDFESNWFSMKMKAGKASYKQVAHGLKGDPAFVRVLVLHKKPGDRFDGFTADGMGGPPCDGVWKGQGSCNEYAGFVFGYNSQNVRIWLPTRGSSQIIYTGDGWGNEAYAMYTTNNYQTFVKVVAWKTYGGASKPDFDQSVSMEAGGSSSVTYKSIPHTLNEMPMHVLVTAEALSGANKGYKFYSRGASVVDDDYGKWYGGLVSAANEKEVRLWVPSGSNRNGYIILTRNGWGGEALPSAQKKATVRVRMWAKSSVPEPTFSGQWVQMCDHPSYRGTVNAKGQSWVNDFGWKTSIMLESLPYNFTAMPQKSPLPKPNGKGRPSRVVVQTYAIDGPNQGFIFECVPGGGDDEYDNGAGCMFIHRENDIVVYAPTRNNAGSARRFLGVTDGWGSGQKNQASKCAMVRVLVWA